MQISAQTKIYDINASMDYRQPEQQEQPEAAQLFGAQKQDSFSFSGSESAGTQNSVLYSSSQSSSDSVGKLARELAAAQSRLDVMMVSSKVSRALLELRRLAANTTDDGRKQEINNQIRRMEKLQKQVRKKLKNLTKEAALERRRKAAEEKQEKERAQALRSELRKRRAKRRKEESDYAIKETLKDQGLNSGSLPVGAESLAASAGTVPFSAAISAAASAAASAGVSADISAAAAAVPAASASLDVVV